MFWILIKNFKKSEYSSKFNKLLILIQGYISCVGYGGPIVHFTGELTFDMLQA
jgi:hypothetical protein